MGWSHEHYQRAGPCQLCRDDGPCFPRGALVNKSIGRIIWEIVEVVVYLAGWIAVAIVAILASSLPKRR
jgi:hypothetical protein